MIPRIRAVVLSTYVDVARLVGLDPFAMLREHRIDAKVLAQPEVWISAAPAIGLLEESALRSGRADFTLLMVERRTYGSLGPVSLLLRHLANAQEVLAELMQFRRLIADTLAIGLRLEDDVATIRCHFSSANAGLQTNSFILAIVYRVVTGAVGGVWQPECVHFTHERPADIETFQRFFRCDLQFASSFNGFSCSPAAMLADNPFADAELAAHARRLLDLVPARTPGDNVADRARYAISLLLGAGQATIGQVSAHLDMSARSLQRSLEREGFSFAELLNETRRQRALQYLNATSLPMTEIAVELGYAGGSTFTRWFNHEFGETPAAWRSRMVRRRRPLPRSLRMRRV